MIRSRPPKAMLTKQIEGLTKVKPEEQVTSAGDGTRIISTGSTLLDLAISGGRIRHGGIPAGIMVEIFGPSGSGKTALLCELAGDVRRKGGQVVFLDPEGRLDTAFAVRFGLDCDQIKYERPDTIPQMFKPVREWEPEPGPVHGVFADSLAALSTEMEMEGSDKMGMRRAKEFSEELRKTCRVIANKGYLMVCSNQIRQTQDTYGPKFKSPGGEAIGFYSSLRLQTRSPHKIVRKARIHGKEIQKVIGIETEIVVHKSSVWEPFNSAPICVIYDYGIDDIRANVQYVKTALGKTTFELDGQSLGRSLEDAIHTIEEEKLERKLRKAVTMIWMETQDALRIERKGKRR